MITYEVTALQMPIYFNVHGDHDPNGLIFTLTKNTPILKYIRALIRVGWPPQDCPDDNDTPDKWRAKAIKRAEEIGVELPHTTKDARKPHPLVRPLVLRANLHDRVTVKLHNEIRGRHVGIHLVGDGYDVREDDGSHIGRNPPSIIPHGGRISYSWQCDNEGVFPFHDGGNYSGGEDGTNVHGLFGALVVEPEGAIWRDPVTGRRSVDRRGRFIELDGLYLDVLPPRAAELGDDFESDTTLDNHQWPTPVEYHDYNREAHREYVIFFHDEPEFEPAPAVHNPCATHEHDVPPIMPISYRAEPMIDREYLLWKRLEEGPPLLRPVLNEEQHHSSWMFGDPATPILKAYIGDPVRIRFVHLAVKETHVFHLHLYEWHAVPQDQTSPRIDAISVSPQTGHTIEPLWGAGNRQQVAGDVIWHCHLYPHFHEGMWGIFRVFETLQNGQDGDYLESSDPIYAGRRIGCYPDGTRIERLLPLPDRSGPVPDRPAPPPRPTPQQPGYPLYIRGYVNEKSPRPPWPHRPEEMPADYDYRLQPTDLERNAFNDRPVPGELFTRNPFALQQDREWRENPKFEWNGPREVSHNVVVAMRRIDYNGNGWHDKHGHLFYLEDEGPTEPERPLFFRANHGQILNLKLRNSLEPTIPGTEFDPPFPPCDKLPWEGECALHVHMVKFDPICGDGASVGWNYISGPTFGKRMVYRWWADKEFGTIFFHDHLFANYRQKHGLFGALIVEPIGAKFYDNFTNREIISGLQALIVLRELIDGRSRFREFCIGIGDFIPMWDRNNNPLNPPDHPGGHGDQGVMALNYRNTPIRERGGDPAFWFSSLHHGDPYTTRFVTYANDPLWFRVVQGSHEEQHSFQIHGMRWRRFRGNPDSTIRNQQTFGIAEAFTFINHEPYGAGDYLYKLSAADDLWLGCWGIIRAHARSLLGSEETEGLIHLEDAGRSDDKSKSPGAGEDPVETDELQAAPTVAPPRRRFYVVAEPKRLVYREREPDLVDPFGLVFRLTREWRPGEQGWTDVPAPTRIEPLILRCREGEQIEVTVENRLPNIPGPEPRAPEVPVEKHNRPVSEQVSLHADLLLYDVTRNDGANVGRNPQQTILQGGTRTYVWLAASPPGSDARESLGPALLQDMADFRNHRHHGLVGALIVEPRDTTPLAVGEGEMTAGQNASEAWHGARATLVRGQERAEEIVLLLQDGLRLYRNGQTHDPVPDYAPNDDDAEIEDQGNKGFNYRSEPVGFFDRGERRDILGIPDPETPVWRVPVGQKVQFHLVGASDKPRNYSFTIHGVTWPEWRFLSEERRPLVASESAITCGTVRTFEFTPRHDGDYAYRSGMLKWAVHQGLWGILRVGESLAPHDHTEGGAHISKPDDAGDNQRVSGKGLLTGAGLAFGLGLLAGLRLSRRYKGLSRYEQKPPCQYNELEESLRETARNFALRRDRPAVASPEVRVVYLVPSDINPRPNFRTTAANAAVHLQRWYMNQMGNNQSFILHNPVVSVVRSSHTAAWYSTNPQGDDPSMRYWYNATADGFALTGGGYFDPNNIWLFYVDADTAPGQKVGAYGGVALLPRHDVVGLLGQSSQPVCRWVGGLGHELGHALGLPHPVECEGTQGNPGSPKCSSLMYLGYLRYDDTFLLDEDRDKLNQSPFIMPVDFDTPPFNCSDV